MFSENGKIMELQKCCRNRVCLTCEPKFLTRNTCKKTCNLLLRKISKLHDSSENTAELYQINCVELILIYQNMATIMLQKSKEAALRLKEEYNLNAEIIDLQTLRPLDTETILNSVKKTKIHSRLHYPPKISCNRIHHDAHSTRCLLRHL